MQTWREWWESGDDVTLITRPRRFGKTLTMDMLEQFFSVKYKDRGSLFEGLAIWEDETYRGLQGTYPVIFLSFASVKGSSFSTVKKMICQNIKRIYNQNDFLLDAGCLNDAEKEAYQEVSAEMEEYLACDSLKNLSEYLQRYYGKKVVILLDEYDTPLQEAYVNGYWEELTAFTRSLFNSTFKTNPGLERAVMTGITRISRESIFSDLNNLAVVTTTSEQYRDSFGFTEQEVFKSLEEYGLTEKKEEVKRWYDGFTFGTCRDIYNPWSILNYLKTKRFDTYWANTSSNSLVGKLIREGSKRIKTIMEDLLEGKILHAEIDEQVIFNQLDQKESAIWSLLLASGYLRVENFSLNEEEYREEYGLALTNRENGFGRYDVMLEPSRETDDAIIIEFKVFRPAKEKTLEDTLKAAHARIEEKKYAAVLEGKGIAPGRIRKYGFAFEGKKVLIG